MPLEVQFISLSGQRGEGVFGQGGVWLGGFWPGGVWQEGGVCWGGVCQTPCRNYIADSNNMVALRPWGWYRRHLRNPGSVTGFCTKLFCHFIHFLERESFFMKR